MPLATPRTRCCPSPTVTRQPRRWSPCRKPRPPKRNLWPSLLKLHHHQPRRRHHRPIRPVLRSRRKIAKKSPLPVGLFFGRCGPGCRQRKSPKQRTAWGSDLAETEGFEPSMRLYTPYSLSRGAPSATRSRFLTADIISRLRPVFLNSGLKAMPSRQVPPSSMSAMVFIVRNEMKPLAIRA